MRKAAEAESERARADQWRDVSFAERARVGAELFEIAVIMARKSGYRKPTLAYARIPNV